MDRIKVDFIAPPFSGHLNPLIELARSLPGRDFEVRFITGPRKIKFLKDIGFCALPILAHDPDAMERIADTAAPVKSSPVRLWKQLKQNLSILPSIKAEIKALLQEQATDIVVADFVAVPAGIVCQEDNIPWITTIPTPFAIETKAGTPSYLGGWPLAVCGKGRYRDIFGRAIVRRFKVLLEFIFGKEFNALNFRLYRSDGSESAYSSELILGLGMKEFEFPRDWPAAFKFIGPCCRIAETVSVLDLPVKGYRNKVLVTLGTHLQWAKKRIQEDLKSFAACFKDTVFVFSLGRSGPVGGQCICKEGNVMVYEYIPYDPYLEKFDAVIHHGGAGIVYSCIKFQKPSLVLPQDYDQFDFAARIEHHHLGIRIRQLCSEAAVGGLKKVLSGEFRESMARMNVFFQQYGPGQELEKEIRRMVAKRL